MTTEILLIEIIKSFNEKITNGQTKMAFQKSHRSIPKAMYIMKQIVSHKSNNHK